MTMLPEIQELLDRSSRMPEQRTPAWYEMRLGMLTASDAGSVLGTNRYSSRMQVLKNKVDAVLGMGFGEKFTGNAATKWGQDHEDEVRDRFDQEYGVKSYDCGLLPHPEHPWLGASPDGLVSDGSLIEIKCPMTRQIKPGYIPEYYLDQIQLQLEVTGLPKCYFVEWQPGKRMFDDDVFQVQVVDRDPTWWERSLPVMRTFWDEVQYYVANPEAAMEEFVTKKRSREAPAKRETDAVTEDIFCF